MTFHGVGMYFFWNCTFYINDAYKVVMVRENKFFSKSGKRQGTLFLFTIATSLQKNFLWGNTIMLFQKICTRELFFEASLPALLPKDLTWMVSENGFSPLCRSRK